MTPNELTIDEQKVRFKEIFEHSPYAVFIHDYNKILDVNAAFLHLYGYDTKKEIIGKSPISALVVPEDIDVCKSSTDNQLLTVGRMQIMLDYLVKKVMTIQRVLNQELDL